MNFFPCIADDILLLLAGSIVFFVVTRISHFIKARRGNPQKFWENHWAAKERAEQERLKDPTYRAQKVWDDQEERNKANQRQMAHELITATGRYKHRKPMNHAEVLEKIRLEERPFANWMLIEYLDGSLLNENQKLTHRFRRWFNNLVER